MNFYPNPSTAQIFAIEDKTINLKFSTTKDLLLNIVSISGIGKFRWSDKSEKDAYYLDGYDDRLTMTAGTDDNGHKLDSLKAISSIVGTHEEYKGGFVFYITYYPRGTIDQLKKNRDTEFQYRTVKMPLNFYFPINFKNSWTINFIFYNINLKSDKNLEYNNNLFNIWGTIISNNTASAARYDPKQRPNYDNSCIKGEFDSSFGTLFIDSNYIDKLSSEKKIKQPNIFISIDRDNDLQFDFDSLGFEINIFSNSSKGYDGVQEGLFISGKLSDTKKNIYLLKCYKDKIYMKVEYTANSEHINFALSKDPKNETNDKFKNLTIEEVGGVSILTMYFDDSTFPENGEIYFIVFTKENLKSELSHFSFRYSSSKVSPTIIPIISKDESKIKVDINSPDYTITFKQIPIKETSYYIKAYYKTGFNEGEKVDTIAISESPGEIIQINEPNLNTDEKYSFKMTTNKGISYIKVMARINMGEFKEFYSYTPNFVNTDDISEPQPSTSDPPSNNDKDKDIILYVSIGVGSAFVVIIIILIVFVTLYKKKNNDLAKQDYTVELSGGESGENAIFTKEDSSPKFELRLLGMYADDAIKALQRQLDLCVMQNFKNFSVIHGKGNGILQQAVQDFLSHYPGVKNFYFARPEDGGFGKTYVEMM